MDVVRVLLQVDPSNEEEPMTVIFQQRVPGVGWGNVDSETFADKAALESGLASAIATAFPNNEPPA